MPDITNGFTVHETHLPARLGCSHHDVRAWRKTLLKGQDFVTGGKGRVFWSEEAVERVRLAIEHGSQAPAGAGGGISGGPDSPQPEKTAAAKDCKGPGPAASADGEVVTVEKPHFPNPFVIQARRENGEMVLVRVKTSRNFRRMMPDGRPMTLRARKEGENWWLVGPCPRWPGKW